VDNASVVATSSRLILFKQPLRLCGDAPAECGFKANDLAEMANAVAFAILGVTH